MSTFFKTIFSPFTKNTGETTTAGNDGEGSTTSQTGPYSTGTQIEAQLPSRRRSSWRRDNGKATETTNGDSKSEKTSGSKKMGTISGVFVPTTLNVMSILMYLRVHPPSTSSTILTSHVVRFYSRTKWRCRHDRHARRILLHKPLNGPVRLGDSNEWKGKGWGGVL